MAITWAGILWAAGVIYVRNDRVVNGPNVYLCTGGGVSDLYGTGPSGTGDAIPDGTVTWAFIGANGGAVLDIAALDVQLSAVPVAMQRALLVIVDQQVGPDPWEELQDTGAKYLAAHLGALSLRQGRGGAITAEAVGQMSRSYSTPQAIHASLASTSWGVEYDRLVHLLPSAVGFVV